MKTRTQNAVLNTLVGIITQVLTVVITFVERKIFVNYLTVDYLGINGLFSNILSLLALSELGITSVVVYYLYKPVYDNDTETICSIVNYFKKIFWIIAAFMFAVGLACIPLLQFIIKSDFEIKDIIIYYLLFLANSVITIPLAPKLALLNANQNQRLQRTVTIGCKILLSVIHIFILILTHNYIIYISANLITTFLSQVIISHKVDKLYPYLKNSGINSSLIDYKGIIIKVKSNFLCKIGSTIINSTDNILISIIVNTATVGFYSNYTAITGAITAFIAVLNTAISSGVGNLSAENDKKKMFSIFKALLLFYQFTGTFCGICFYFLAQDFITWWLGEEYLLSISTVIAISLRLESAFACVPVWTFRDANGLFEKVKYEMLIDACLNLVLSVILGRIYGISGILFATVIADVLTAFIYDPYIVYKFLFDKKLSDYALTKLRNLALMVVSFILCAIIQNYMPHNFLMLFVKGCIFTVAICCVFYIGTIGTEERKQILQIVKQIKNRNKNN